MKRLIAVGTLILLIGASIYLYKQDMAKLNEEASVEAKAIGQ